MSQKPLTYADAGVSIDAGNALVKAIGPLARSTARPGAEAELGGFGGFFDLKAAGYSDPLLVAANDGVGTKLKLAIEAGRHDGGRRCVDRERMPPGGLCAHRRRDSRDARHVQRRRL